MIDYNALKALFPNGLPEAHNVLATVKAHLTYQILRKEYGYAATNRKTWKQFKKAYEEATKPVVVAVTGVTMSPKTLTIEAGKTGKLTGTVAPANATNKSVTYTSADPTKATVAADGTVTVPANLAKDGTVVITVKTADGNKTDTATVTVKAPAGGV